MLLWNLKQYLILKMKKKKKDVTKLSTDRYDKKNSTFTKPRKLQTDK